MSAPVITDVTFEHDGCRWACSNEDTRLTVESDGLKAVVPWDSSEPENWVETAQSLVVALSAWRCGQ